MLRRVALVRTDVSEELSASIIRVRRFGELGTTISVNKQPTHAGDYEECRLLGYNNPISYLAGDKFHLRYRVQPVNAM
jgi:hypothetical protein